ncbi:unnamed protein product, partial [Rotaria sp. Silwood2]
MKNKDQIIDFIAEPFVATIDNMETLIVVLNELAEELGARLSFTEKAFQYDDSDRRTACGIGNLGSIHSIVGDGGSAQTAHFRLHLNLSYDDLISTAEKFKNFTITLITDIASMIGCEKEFIPVFSVSRASSAHADIDSSGTIREYQVVFQCRVENDQFTEHHGPVSVGLALRVFNEKAIRPY